MKQVEIFDAKTHLSNLIDEVERGREIVITRQGKPVAKLVCADERLSPKAFEKRKQALQDLRKIGQRLNLNLTHEEIKARIEERRH